MKVIKTATFLTLGIILVNCGGDSSSSEPVSVSSLTKQARVNQVSATSVGFREQASLRGTGKMQLQAKQDSGEAINCEEGGTYTYETKEIDNGSGMTGFLFSNNKCQEKDSETGRITEENGFMSFVYNKNKILISIGYKDYTIKPDINKKNIINSYPYLVISKIINNGVSVFGVTGDAKFMIDGKNINKSYTYKDYFYASDGTHVHIEGSEKIITSCGSTSNFYEDYNGDFNYLTKHDTEPRYYKSGIIVVNGLKYDYRGEDIILSKGTESETVSQASILAEEDARHSCSQKNTFLNKNLDTQKLKNTEYLKNVIEIASKLQSHSSKMEIKK